MNRPRAPVTRQPHPKEGEPMILGLDLGSVLLVLAVVLIIFLAVDLLTAGGGCSATL